VLEQGGIQRPQYEGIYIYMYSYICLHKFMYVLTYMYMCLFMSIYVYIDQGGVQRGGVVSEGIALELGGVRVRGGSEGHALDLGNFFDLCLSEIHIYK
jgi:hypothetical protein